MQLQSTQAELAHSQSQLQSIQAELAQYQFQLQSTQVEIERSQSQLHSTQAELDRSLIAIAAMKSSKFWKLRERWISFKRLISVLSKQFLFFVDSPTCWEIIGSDLQVSGWCFSTSRSKLKAVRARIGERTFNGIYGIDRPDVAQAFAGIAGVEKSGFHIQAHLSSGRYKLVLEAQDTLEKWHLLASYPIIVHPSPGFVIPQPIAPYDAWLAMNQWNERSFAHLKSRLKACQGSLPKISVVMPVFNPLIEFLELAIASLVNQVYENWELCIADDCSTDLAVHSTLKRWAANDARIHVVFREENGNISAPTNSAAIALSSL